MLRLYNVLRLNSSLMDALTRKTFESIFSNWSFVNEPVQFAGMMRHYGYFITKQEVGVLNPTTVTIGHPGGGSGYVSLLQYSPELDASVSILMNFLWRKGPGKCDVNRQRISMNRCIASGIFAAYADALR